MFRKGNIVAVLFAAALVAMSGVAEARVGGGASVGSRGARTFSPPPVTQTAPRTAAPINRTITQPSVGQPGVTAPRGGLFGGFAGGLFAGFLGAGLFGLLFGNGLFGGLTGFGSIFGLLLQLGLVFFIARWAFGWFARRNQPAFAGASGGGFSPSGAPLRDLRSVAAPERTNSTRRPNDELGLVPADFDRFEQILGEVQTAYGREDLGTLRRLLTPEMFTEIGNDLAANASRGVVNRVSDVKLLKGDLAEAWREGSAQYATVAMRYAVRDVTEERAGGRVVETGPAESTEVWTFRRQSGGDWVLSAIQQT